MDPPLEAGFCAPIFMRTSKKIVSVFLALAMAWSLVPNTLAEQAGTGSDTITISASVVWDDADNQDGIRPDSVEVHLMAVGEALEDTQSACENNSWSVSWQMPAYNADQEEIHYSVSGDVQAEGYIVKTTGNVEEGFIIKGSYEPKTLDIPIAVEWEDEDNADGIRPEQVAVSLCAAGINYGDAVLEEGTGWEYVFSDVPQCAEGYDIIYSVQLSAPEGYSGTILGNSSGFTVTFSREEEKYTVTYDLAGGSSETEQLVYSELKDGDATPEIAQPTKEGWSFVGWDPEVAELVTEDVTYTAQWVENIPEVKTVSVAKQVNLTSAEVGDILTYTVSVANTGNVALSQVVVTDEMLGKNETIDLLDVGETVSFAYSYRVSIRDEGKKLVNTAIVWIDGTNAGEASCFTWIEEQVYIPPIVPQLNKEEHIAYIVGKDDGLVHPLDYITRAETATIFFRLLTEESRQEYDTLENSYVDVSGTAWYNRAVSTLTRAGIFVGRPDNRFAPTENITRGEFAALVIRFFQDSEVETVEHTLADISGHWAEEDVYTAYALGLITGYPDETYRPDQEITRAEAIAVVNRVLDRHPDKEYLLDEMIVWDDNIDPHVWYYADIQEATNSHTYVMMETGESEKYEVWKQLIETRDWVQFEK